MLATLLAWLYISFLCWAWGTLFLQLVQRATKSELLFPHFSIICITGLSLITIMAGVLSLFIPLGEWWVQFIFIIPALLIYFTKYVPYFFSTLKKELSSFHILSLSLLIMLLLLILVMSSWKIVHPDTLGYHAQTIQWIEKYNAVPGLVHLHARFGYQGFWFVDCALFDFAFTGKPGINFLNTTVLFWSLLFMINRIDHNFYKDGKKIYGLLWTGLLSLSLWSYTQVRLTATSASPDFVAAIFVLLVIYLLIENGSKHLDAAIWLLAGLISMLAVTIKLSVAPILLVALAASLFFLVNKKLKPLIFIIAIGLLTIAAFSARNVITSGYVVFPSTAIDVANVDWKYSRALTANEKDYIAAYARNPAVVTKEEIVSTNKMKISEWLPGWWNQRSVADKTIMILLLSSFIAGFGYLKKITRSGFLPLFSLITILAGIVFWFINAPDPRFGFGFILGLMGVIGYVILKEKEISIRKTWIAAILVSLCLLTFSYTIYRFVNFFASNQLLTPVGIPEKEYKNFECGGIRFNSPINGQFGTTPIPCTDLDCTNFSPRGKKINDGFRSK